MLFTSIVNEDVVATKAVPDVSQGFGAKRLVGYVAGQEHRVAVLGSDEFLSEFGVVMFVEIKNGNLCAFPGKGNCRRPPDTTVTAGNKGNFSRQLSSTGKAWREIGLWPHQPLKAWLAVLLLRG
jgi:hypothetical protein